MTPEQTEKVVEALRKYQRMVLELYPQECTNSQHQEEFKAVYVLYNETLAILSEIDAQAGERIA